MINFFKLDNGIRCIVNKIDGVFSVTSGILVGAGSALESDEENGISHFIEHVNFKGTTKRTAFQISSDTDNLGAQINAFTSKEFTCYYIKSTGEHFAESFEILSDLYVNSTYPDEELVKERGVVVEEINMYEDTPDEVCTDGLSLAYFGNDGYGRTILGSAKNVNSFNRDSVLKYKEKYYTSDNTVVCFAGALDIEQAKALCEKYLGGLKTTKMQIAPSINKNNLCGDYISNKDIEQAHIALAFPSVGICDKNSDAFSLVCGALGGGMSSRLFQTVREEKGLAYSVYSYLSSYKDCGSMMVYAGVGKTNDKSAYSAIIDVLTNLKKQGITKEEFLRTREQMKSSFVLSQESTASQMILFGKYLLFTNDIFDIQKKIDDINSLTLEGINELIFDSLNIQEMSTSIVGNGVSKLR